MTRTTRAILGVFFVVVIAVSAIAITRHAFRHFRLDITEQKLYTLSDGTREILSGLHQPVTIKLFYTKTAAMFRGPDQIRYYNNYFGYVKSLLEEYEKQAKGKVRLEIIDPRPWSQEEMAAMRYGLRRFSLSEEENFFFGLVVQTEYGVTKQIEFFSPERQQFVEYDISYLIDTAVTRQKTRVGVLSSLPVMGDSEYMLRMMQMQGQQGNRKWGIIAHLENQYEVIPVPADTEDITDVDLLFVIHPKDLPDRTVFAIDQFVLRGGRAIVCVDPHSIADMPSPQQQQFGGMHEASSNIPQLLKAWGLEMPDMTFAGDRSLAVLGSPNPNQRPERILGILKMEHAAGSFNPDHPATAQLGEVTVVFPGVLRTLPSDADGPKLEHTPLLMTSPQGNSWTVSNPYELMRPDYARFLREFRDGTAPVTMGYLVTGRFRSAFPGGLPVADEGGDGDAPKTLTGLTESVEPGAVVVLSDVDFISDLVAYQRTIFGLSPVGDNSAVILNALESLSGSSRLMSVRSRGSYRRPFTVVDKKEAEAVARTAEEESRIEAQIRGFEQELNAKIRTLEGDDRGELISKTILQEKKDIELQLLEAEQRLRQIKMQKRESIESLKGRMRFYCTVPGPVLTLVIAVGLGVHRAIRRRRYISHASDS